MSFDQLLYEIGQLFLIPVLLAIAILFAHALAALGAFGWQAWQRRSGSAAGFELHALAATRPELSLDELEADAVRRLEPTRIASRVTPMLGLVATMIPLGPALRALGQGQLPAVANHLTQAFSAVILALLAAAITHSIAQVRRRWYADELRQLGHRSGGCT